MESVNVNNFDEVISKGIVLVDFFAQWCGPCKMQGPVLQQLASENPQLVKVVKIDVDENSELAARYQVSSIPNMIFFKDGKLVNRVIGFQSKENLLEIIKSL